MPTTSKIYTNEDDALIFWIIDKPIPACRGFAIERKITRQGQTTETRDFLLNRTGFEGEKPPADPKGHGITKPSNEWPFQRFSWTDHDAQTGDTVSYRVIPMTRDDSGKLQPVEADASEFSAPRVLGAVPADSQFRAFFNRGFVISQFMSRFLKENNLSLKQFKDLIKTDKTTEHTIREFLSGDLRKEVLNLLETASTDGTDVFAALFELSDGELIKALTKLGKKAHVVLSNGSVQAKTGTPAAEARKGDENAPARKTLLEAKVDVEKANRFISPGALGHNKFLVVTDKKGKAVQAWTGSTNWAPTGLCTQVNNGLLINDAGIAKIYLDQWKRLRAAKSDFPKDLVASNSKPKPAGNHTVWFTRTSKRVDLDAINAEVAAAKTGILFLMFMPGATGVLGNVMKRAGEPGLYVRGVVSELPNGRNDETQVDVHLVSGTDQKQLHLDIIQPEGIKNPMANFVAEVTHNQFLSQIGHAIIHSKILVIDPFGDKPVVVTGSHNFSTSASSGNDENFIVIRGDKALAEAYSVNIEGAYQHYRFRAFLEQTGKPFNGLKDDDTWEAPKLAGAAQELKFWGL